MDLHRSQQCWSHRRYKQPRGAKAPKGSKGENESGTSARNSINSPAIKILGASTTSVDLLTLLPTVTETGFGHEENVLEGKNEEQKNHRDHKGNANHAVEHLVGLVL